MKTNYNNLPDELKRRGLFCLWRYEKVNGRLSPLTVRRYYTMISSLMKSAYRLGHTRLKTTNRYVHAVDQAERQAANTLELILGGNRKTG